MECRASGCRLGGWKSAGDKLLAVGARVDRELLITEQIPVDVVGEPRLDIFDAADGFGEGKIGILTGSQQAAEFIDGRLVCAVVAEYQVVHERPGLRVESLQPVADLVLRGGTRHVNEILQPQASSLAQQPKV